MTVRFVYSSHISQHTVNRCHTHFLGLMHDHECKDCNHRTRYGSNDQQRCNECIVHVGFGWQLRINR
jgi:hypothetical protein